MELIRNCDAIELLQSLEDSSIDLVLTDPAYESMEKHRKIGTTTRLQRWFPVFPNERFQELFTQFWRVLKNNTHLYIFSDVDTLPIMKSAGELAGFKFWKPLIWYKTGPLGMGYHYRNQYEFILFFEKGKRKLNSLAIPDVLPFPRINKGYPTQKPIPVLRTLIGQSSLPGERVCDPFSGSGSTLHACREEAVDFVGCDINPDAPIFGLGER